MSSATEGKWAYASSEEGPFHGEFDTAQEAVFERFGWPDEGDDDGDYLDQRCYVGEIRAPQPASMQIHAEDIIERIQCEGSDYQGDWAENWPDASGDQLIELTESLRAAFDAWEAKHNLKPRFFMVDGAVSMSVREAVEASRLPDDPPSA